MGYMGSGIGRNVASRGQLVLSRCGFRSYGNLFPDAAFSVRGGKTVN